MFPYIYLRFIYLLFSNGDVLTSIFPSLVFEYGKPPQLAYTTATLFILSTWLYAILVNNSICYKRAAMLLLMSYTFFFCSLSIHIYTCIYFVYRIYVEVLRKNVYLFTYYDE